MAGDLTRWRAASLERVHDREVAQIARDVKLGRIKMFGVEALGEGLMGGTSRLAALKKTLETPEDGELLHRELVMLASMLTSIAEGVAIQWIIG